MVYQPKRERVVFRSAVQANLLSLKVRRGSLLAGCGALLIILGGTFLSKELLSLLGIPIFLTGLLLIGLGLLPYKRLCQLQLKPNEIHCNDSSLLFLKGGKPLFQLGESCIDKMHFIKNEEEYGLGIWLKRPIQEKVKVFQPRFDLASFVAKSSTFEGCDLFLPYFSEQTCAEILETGLD